MPAPKHIENLFRLLLPPACREHVLGDLHERFKSPRQYLAEGLAVLPPVIISRIRRTTDFQVLLIEALALYGSFSAAAVYLGQKAFLYDQAGFALLAIPTTVAEMGLLICNAYTDPAKPLWFKPLMQSAGSIALAFLGQAMIFDTQPSLAIPFSIMLYGSCISLLLVSTLRMLFRPALNSPKMPSVNDLRLLKQRNLFLAKLPFQQIRWAIGEVRFSFKTKVTLACAAALLCVTLICSTIWH